MEIKITTVIHVEIEFETHGNYSTFRVWMLDNGIRTLMTRQQTITRWLFHCTPEDAEKIETEFKRRYDE